MLPHHPEPEPGRGVVAPDRVFVPTIYSHSRLSSFENCPKQFEFRYVLKIPAETEGIEAFVGKRVHEILERLYEFVDRGQVPPLAKVVERYLALFDEQYDADRVRIVKEGLDVAFYRDLGVRCLHNYYRNHYPFDAGETLGIEERVLFDLDDKGEYRIQGIIDRISRAADGTVEIHDYKTGQWVPGQKRLDEDRQLALYQIGLQKVYGPDQPMRLVWHYVSRGVTRTSERTGEQLDALRYATIDLIDTVQRERAYEPTQTKLCGWCEYRSICPLFAEDPNAAARAVETKRAARKSSGSATPTASPGRSRPEPALPAPGSQLTLL